MKLLNTLAAFAVISLPAIAFAADTVGKIETGQNSQNAFIVAPDGTKTEFSAGQTIPVGTGLETGEGGSAGLFFSDGAAVALRSGAKLTATLFTQDSDNVPASGFSGIKKEDGTSQLALSFTRGTGVFDASKLNSLSNLLVRTTILRTETNDGLFALEVAEKRVTVSVVSGAVVVVPLFLLGGTEPIILVAGEQGAFSIESGDWEPDITKLSAAEASRLAGVFSGKTQFGLPDVTTYGAKHSPTITPIDNTIVQPRVGGTPVVSPNGEGQGI